MNAPVLIATDESCNINGHRCIQVLIVTDESYSITSQVNLSSNTEMNPSVLIVLTDPVAFLDCS